MPLPVRSEVELPNNRSLAFKLRFLLKKDFKRVNPGYYKDYMKFIENVIEHCAERCNYWKHWQSQLLTVPWGVPPQKATQDPGGLWLQCTLCRNFPKLKSPAGTGSFEQFGRRFLHIPPRGCSILLWCLVNYFSPILCEWRRQRSSEIFLVGKRWPPQSTFCRTYLESVIHLAVPIFY